MRGWPTLFEKGKKHVGSVADQVKAASQINVEEHKEDLPFHIKYLQIN